ncbi:MAG: peptidoglycan editing factor PgeF [bacterium]|nr:peptidoglycan editing factor PgeF [bacterium]
MTKASYSFGTRHSQIPTSDIIISPNQVHGSHVHVVTNENLSQTHPPDTDALVTMLPDVALTVVTADCVPIIYRDTQAEIIGISHSGWKGIAQDIIGSTIGAMEATGATTATIDAIVGPAIGPCCYPIYGDRKVQFQKLFNDDIFVEYPKYTGLNLTKAAYLLLIKHGISPSHIKTTISCTSCQSDQYYSYRREGSAKNHMVHFIKI